MITLKKSKLPITEELDFQYLLALMQPLHNVKEFAWLPELFSIIGHESLVKLCQYAGGEQIRIPTLTQLTDSIDALQAFYDVYIKKCKMIEDVPDNLISSVNTILEVYDATDD